MLKVQKEEGKKSGANSDRSVGNPTTLGISQSNSPPLKRIVKKSEPGMPFSIEKKGISKDEDDK